MQVIEGIGTNDVFCLFVSFVFGLRHEILEA